MGNHCDWCEICHGDKRGQFPRCECVENATTDAARSAINKVKGERNKLANENADLRYELARVKEANSTLIQACEQVLQCKKQLDKNGHAYIKVPCRSVFDLGAQLAALVEQARKEKA